MNTLKTPFALSQNQFARDKALDAIQLTGRSLPARVVKASKSFMTVSFQISSIFTLMQVTVPLIGPEYIRYPMQSGDGGFLVAADARLGGISGQGGGTATLNQPGNLSALVFIPFATTAWSEVDPQAVTIYGPNGVVMRDTGSGAVVTVLPTQITLAVGSVNITINASGITLNGPVTTIDSPVIVLNGELSQGTGATSYAATLQGPVTVIQEVTANGIPLSAHVHPGVQPGTGDTGAPIV